MSNSEPINTANTAPQIPDAPPPPYAGQAQATYTPPKPGLLARAQAKGGPLGTLAALLFALFKWVGPVVSLLGKFKFLTTGLTMLASMGFQAMAYGWPMAVGIVMLIFIHECGHAWAAKRLGKPVKSMVFIPFMGAFVATTGGKSAREDAYIGIMGPVIGSAAALVPALVYAATGNPFWLTLAQWGLLVNLFNLLPVAPLDGGWIVPLFSPKVLAFGAVLLLPLAYLNPLIGLLGLLSLPRIIAGWRAKPSQDSYFAATARDRWQFGMVYLGLVAFLAVSVWGLNKYETTNHPKPRPVVATTM